MCHNIWKSFLSCTAELPGRGEAPLRGAACNSAVVRRAACSMQHAACGVQRCSRAVCRGAACSVRRCGLRRAVCGDAVCGHAAAQCCCSVRRCGPRQCGGTARRIAVHRCIPTRCPSSPAAWPHPALPATAIHHRRPASPLPDNEGKSAFSGEPLCCLYKGVWLLTHVR